MGPSASCFFVTVRPGLQNLRAGPYFRTNCRLGPKPLHMGRQCRRIYCRFGTRIQVFRVLGSFQDGMNFNLARRYAALIITFLLIGLAILFEDHHYYIYGWACTRATNIVIFFLHINNNNNNNKYHYNPQPHPSMTLDTQYTSQLAHYRKKIKTQNTCLPSISQLLQSPACESWKILAQLLEQVEREDPRYFRDLVGMMERSLEKVQSLCTLLWMYSLKGRKIVSYFGGGRWRGLYRYCIENGELTILSTWIQSQPNSTIVQNTLSLLTQITPYLVRQQYLTLSEPEIDSIIQWIFYFHTLTPEQYEQVCQTALMVKQNSRSLVMREDYVEKEHAMLKKLMEVCGRVGAGGKSSNVFLFMYPFAMREKDISYFCHMYSDFLIDLDENVMCNFFNCITKSAASPEILYIIDKISIKYKNEQCFYKLRYLYQKFILPHLCRRVKACKKVYQQVFNVCEYYIVGFLKHCNIGVKGIQCIIKSVGKISDWKIQSKWIDLCALVCTQYPELREQASGMLELQLGKQTKLEEIKEFDNMEAQDIIWEVTLRNGRKLKQYNKVLSKRKGITNEENQCYIISVVQALHNGGLLLGLLQSCFDVGIEKYGLLNQLRLLFLEISGKIDQSTIRVRYLKDKGPLQFRNSFIQEDAYEYLIQLFDSIEKQLKPLPEQMLKKFKQTYEVRYIAETTCRECQKKKIMEQFSYAFSIPHTQILRQSTHQKITDFYCQSCSKQGQALILRKIAPSSKILIVHINRFSHIKGTTKKQLSTQAILRQFLHYSLVGMICHRGKNVENGHYVYYHRVGGKKWVVFNDALVEEFQLDREDEEFQREWKAEMTPYILFYQVLDNKQ